MNKSRHASKSERTSTKLKTWILIEVNNGKGKDKSQSRNDSTQAQEPLNISTQTILRITNGSPIAKYAEGTHFKGRLVSVFIIVAVYKACTLHI